MEEIQGAKKGCPRCNEIPLASATACEACGFPLHEASAAPFPELETPPWYVRWGCYFVDRIAAAALLAFCGGFGALIHHPVFCAIAGGVAFFLLRDSMSGGRSPGKRMGGTQVIDRATGFPCTQQQSVRRNLPLVIPLVNMIEAVLVLLGSDRLGDRWAGTRVVRPRIPGRTESFALRCGATIAVMSTIAALGVLAAIAVPNFIAARERANTRACYANQKTIVGALEMYRLDKGMKPEETPALNSALYGQLLTGGYLMSLPTDPGQGPASTDDYYLTDASENGIACRVHGSVDGRVPASRPFPHSRPHRHVRDTR